MARDAHVRAARRRQALEALAFEQDREAVLVEQIEDVAAELAGAELDARLFAAIGPEDARLVREALGQDADDYPDRHDSDGDDPEGDDPEHGGETGYEPDGEDLEAEIVRLEEVLASSRRVRAALERYLALLAEPPA